MIGIDGSQASLSLIPSALCQGAQLKERKAALLKAIAEKKEVLQRKAAAALAASAPSTAKLFLVWPGAG